MSQGKQGTWRPERGTFGHEIQHATSEQNPALSYGFTSDEKTTMDMFENYLIPEYERIKKKGGEPRYPEQLQDVTKALRAVQEYGNDQVLYYLNPDEGRARNQEYRGSLPAKADIGLPFTDPYVPGGITGNRAEVASPENWLADRLYLDYWKHADERGNTSDPKVAGSEPGTARSALDAFTEQALQNAKADSRLKSREVVVEMPIDHFLNLAAPGEDKAKAERLKDVDQFNQIPHLSTDGEQVIGHEGRNRARRMKELGYVTMPVRIIDKNVRWGENPDTRFDTLRAEEGDFSIPHPVKEGEYGVFWENLNRPVDKKANGGEVTNFIRSTLPKKK